MEKKQLAKALFPHLYLLRYNTFAKKKLERNKQLKALSDEERIDTLEMMFLRKVGYKLNLEYPKTWCEKIQWLKLYDATPLKSKFTDKILAKKMVGEMIGEKYVLPMIGEYEAFNDINFNKLPKQFVIKANHGSGCNFFVQNKSFFLYSGLYRVAKFFFKYWMQMDYGFDDGFELHYSAIKPRILVEPYISSLHEDLEEYRFMCFEGEPQYVEVKTGCHGLYRNIYDMNWCPLEVKWGHQKNVEISKPAVFDEMRDLVLVLCKGFHFVRIDFNYCDGKIIFGEMTFTSGSGFIKIEPLDFDRHLGDLIHI